MNSGNLNTEILILPHMLAKGILLFVSYSHGNVHLCNQSLDFGLIHPVEFCILIMIGQ